MTIPSRNLVSWPIEYLDESLGWHDGADGRHVDTGKDQTAFGS